MKLRKITICKKDDRSNHWHFMLKGNIGYFLEYNGEDSDDLSDEALMLKAEEYDSSQSVEEDSCIYILLYRKTFEYGKVYTKRNGKLIETGTMIG